MKHKLSALLSIIALFVFSGFALGGGQPPVCASLTSSNPLYSQNFDTLGTSGGSTSVPVGIGFLEVGASADLAYWAGSGADSSHDTFSYGTAGSTDRAFGGRQGGGFVPTIGGCFTNNTGAAMVGFTVVYDGEMWRLGDSTGPADRLDFQYSTNATSLASGTWIDGDAGDFVSPIVIGSAGALNGNAAANRTAGITVDISSLNIPDGAYFYVRWLDYGVAGSDDGLAIDNLSVTATTASTGTVQFHSSEYVATQTDAYATIILNRLGGQYGAASVNFTMGGGTAQGGLACGGTVDYLATSSTISWADGDNADKTILIPLCNDGLFQGNETVNLTLSNVVGATLGSPNIVPLQILESDTQPTMNFADSTEFVRENAGTLTLTVHRLGATGQAVSVDYSTVGAQATGGVACTPGIDFISKTGTLNFGVGVTSQNFDITICNDSVVETDEPFSVTLSNPGGGAAVGIVGTEGLTILNDDVAGVTLTQSGGSTYVDEDIPTSDTYTVVLTSEPIANVTITMTSGADLSTSAGSLTFTQANWSTPQTVTVSPVDDGISKGLHEQTIVHTVASLDPDYEGVAILDIDVTINDENPVSVEFGARTFSGPEGTSSTVSVTRSGDTSGTSTVDYVTTDETAVSGTCGTSGVHYQAASGTLTFQPTETVKTFNITLCPDSVSENPAQTVLLSLGNPIGGMIGPQSGAELMVLDAATEFKSTTPITITPGAPSSPYGTTIDVTGVSGSMGGLRVTLYGVTHPNPDALQVLLVSPDGSGFVLMAHTGGNTPLINSTITFEDMAPIYLPGVLPIMDGLNYRPANCGLVDLFPSPAPTEYTLPGCGPAGPAFSGTFANKVPNGNWVLYVQDSGAPGIVSSPSATISGWGFQPMLVTAAESSLSGRVLTKSGSGIRNAMVTVAGGNLAEPITVITSTFGYYNVKGLTAGQAYVVSVTAKRYTFTESVRAVQLLEDTTGFDFVADR